MKIQLNGEWITSDYKSVFQIREKLFKKEDIIIVNGFQINQDYTLKENDEIFIISKGTLPPKDKLEKMMAARHTPKVHEALKKGKVAIAGLGGLGSNIAVSLARIGVGQLLLVDFDVVEPSNLNRQSYYISHLGMYKTQALKKQIEEINPFIKVDMETVRVEEENVVSLFYGYDIVCEAFDNPVAKAMLVNTVLEQMPDTKIVSASGMAGYDSGNLIQTKKKMKQFYLCGDFENGAAMGRGLMAPRVQICAGHQANMILRLLLGIEEE